MNTHGQPDMRRVGSEVVHLALGRLDYSDRQALEALFHYRQELRDSARDCKHPEATAARLQWWQQETAALLGGTPQHPVSVRLAPHCGERLWGAAALAPFLNVAALDLEQGTVIDDADFIVRSGDWLQWLKLAALAQHLDPKDLHGTLVALGHALSLGEVIAECGTDAARGRIRLPLTDLNRFHVTPASLLLGKPSEALTALLGFEVSRARCLLDQAHPGLPASSPFRELLVLARTVLDGLEQMQFDVLAQPLRLNPLRLWWRVQRLAWS